MEYVTFWADSLNVVFWIQGQSRDYKPFVSHRIGAIHEHSNPDQWRYVPTKLNPADHGTRGLTVSELAECDLWWNGPKFLLYQESEWPERKSSKPLEAFKEVKCERRAVEQPTTRLPDEEIDQEDSSNSTFVTTNENNWRLHPSRFSKWHRVRRLELGLLLVHVRSWVRRFNNCRVLSDRRLKRELTASEFQDTELEIIRKAQREQFNEEITALATGKELLKRSPLLSLTPIQQAGILRANTRLRQSDDLAEKLSSRSSYPRSTP